MRRSDLGFWYVTYQDRAAAFVVVRHVPSPIVAVWARCEQGAVGKLLLVGTKQVGVFCRALFIRLGGDLGDATQTDPRLVDALAQTLRLRVPLVPVSGRRLAPGLRTDRVAAANTGVGRAYRADPDSEAAAHPRPAGTKHPWACRGAP